MYKVFIENKPIEFRINSQTTDVLNMDMVWQRIESFINNTEQLLTVELKAEDQFFKIFKKYKLIEASGGLVEKDGKYLFIKRNGFWDIPKGKLEGDESPEEGGAREVEEECGIPLPKIERHLINTWHTYTFKGKNVLKKTYWYLMKEGDVIDNLVPQEEEGITEVKFFGREDFPLIKSNTYLSIIEVIEAMEKEIEN